MSQTIRVSLPGKDAGTSTTIDDFALYADSDNVLIKEKERGTVSGNGTVIHDLGYVPSFAAYMGSGDAQWWVYGVGIYAPWEVHATVDKILFYGGTATSKYYLFYDQQV